MVRIIPKQPAYFLRIGNKYTTRTAVSAILARNLSEKSTRSNFDIARFFLKFRSVQEERKEWTKQLQQEQKDQQDEEERIVS